MPVGYITCIELSVICSKEKNYDSNNNSFEF